jgi:hypothetical protein
MEFAQSLLNPSFIFFISATLLIAGLAIDSWRNGYRLSFLDHVRLNVIEREHMHLPSPKVLVTIVVLTTILCAISYYLFNSMYVRFASDTWLVPATFFINVCAFGILAELKWKGARDYAFAFTVCTATTFMLATMMSYKHFSSIEIAMILLVSSLCIVAAQRLLFHAWTHKVRLLAFVTSTLWMFLFFFGTSSALP